MDDQLLRVHRFLPTSRANGPGTRAVIWVQGCDLGCPGCFNPQTHPHQGGYLLTIADLFQRITALGSRIEGITISGGEPLQQWQPVLSLLQRIRRETSLTSVLFTGYTWQEVNRLPGAEQWPACVDVLIAGRYLARQRLAAGLRGSANQTIHLFTTRYRLTDLQAVPSTEVIIAPDGAVILSGVNPLAWTT